MGREITDEGQIRRLIGKADQKDGKLVRSFPVEKRPLLAVEQQVESVAFTEGAEKIVRGKIGEGDTPFRRE